MAQRADGRFQKEIYIGTKNGKVIRKFVYGATQKEVDLKAAELKRLMGKGIDVKSDPPFRDYRDRWLYYKEAEVSERHLRELEGLTKHMESIEDIPIKLIKTSHIKDIVMDLAKRGLSKKRVSDVRRCIEQILEEAVQDRVIDYNPATSVKVPATCKPKKEREPITPEQVKWITDTPHVCQTAAMIMLYAGLRKSEVTALTPMDVDLRNRTIRVNKHIEFIKGRAELRNTTKTRAGMRKVTIPDVLYDYLTREGLHGNYIAFGTSEPVNNYFWTSKWKSYMTDLDFKYGVRTQQIKSKYDPKKKGLVIKTFTPHQLRHTYATMLYDSGVDVMTAQYLLGHDAVETTLGIYTHLTDERKTRSVEKLNEYLREVG